jgi:hypothetical protein
MRDATEHIARCAVSVRERFTNGIYLAIEHFQFARAAGARPTAILWVIASTLQRGQQRLLWLSVYRSAGLGDGNAPADTRLAATLDGIRWANLRREDL